MARKSNGDDSESKARKRGFGEALKWHLDHGTRPIGDPGIDGERWTIPKFAEAIGKSERSVRGWCGGETPPDDLRPIERELFGTNAFYDDYRNELRRAYNLARSDGRAHALGPQSKIDDPGLYIGRDEQVARLVATLLATGGASCLILGDAGHGKTTLTQKVGVHPDIVARFGDRRWFVELEDADSAGSMLSKIAGAIGFEPTAPLEAIQTRLDEKPGLVVLDNLETPLHADDHATETLLRNLAALQRLTIMASLRSKETVAGVGWTEQVWLAPLTPEVARIIFLSIAPNIREDDPDLPYLLEELDGVPLAIRLVARRASTLRDLRDLRRQWDAKGARLAKEAGGDGSRRRSLVDCVEFSLKSRRLKSNGKLLFALLGQSPAGLSLDDCDILLESDGDEAADQLRQVGLLRDSAGRVGLLTPIRDVARRLHRPADGALARWRRHFLSILGNEGARIGKEGGGAAIARLAPEMSNIAAAILASADQLEDRTEALGKLDLFGRTMRYTGISGGAALDKFLQACADKRDVIGQAKCLTARGGWERMRSINEASRADFNSALSLIGEADEFELRGDCLWGLADIARMQSENEKARGLYEAARELYQRAGGLTGEAQCLWGLADIARMQSENEKARGLYEAARELYQRAGSVAGIAKCNFGISRLR